MRWEDETPQAIETHYAGCRFRSRLEARWGVAFDAIGEPWLYEPQGFSIEDSPNPDLNYLPDFYLPRRKLWVEVKGSEEARVSSWRTLVVVSGRMSGLPADPEGSAVPDGDTIPRMLILGPIPRPTWNRLNRPGFLLISLSGRAGMAVQHCDLLGNSTPPIYDARHGQTVTVGGGLQLEGHTVDVATGDPEADAKDAARINYALALARAARFEHGEQPRVTPWLPGEPPPDRSDAA